MELPAFESIESYEKGDHERFYLTKMHQKCADWRLRALNPTAEGEQPVVLSVHSQYLAAASPVFFEMAAENISCKSPIEIGSFDIGAVLAALRWIYRPEAVTGAAVQVLMVQGDIVDVLRLGHKFNFFFYDSLLKMVTPTFLLTVPRSIVVDTAIDVFDDECTELESVFATAISDVLAELQKSGDCLAIDSVAASLSEAPALLVELALAQSLKSLSLSGPRAMYAICGKKKDTWENVDTPQALYTFSFCRCRDREGSLPTTFYSPTFKFEGLTFIVSVQLNDARAGQRGKFVGVYLHLEEKLEKAEAVTLQAHLRVVNLRNHDSSWNESARFPPLWKDNSNCGFTVAPVENAQLPTASGPMFCVQVVTMEKINN